MHVFPRIVLAVVVFVGMIGLYSWWDPAAIVKASVSVGGREFDLRIYDNDAGVYGSTQSGHLKLLVPSEQIRERPVSVTLMANNDRCEITVDGQRFKVSKKGDFLRLQN